MLSQSLLSEFQDSQNKRHAKIQTQELTNTINNFPLKSMLQLPPPKHNVKDTLNRIFGEFLNHLRTKKYAKTCFTKSWTILCSLT